MTRGSPWGMSASLRVVIHGAAHFPGLMELPQPIQGTADPAPPVRPCRPSRGARKRVGVGLTPF
ncbi:hypothetical protein GCM10023144_16090 [Pigmentiphaga soli]|uniref:Uncharacterized protein n=1 Tax=Pigmentiphaga soli TaxID=1007095 RepID=A0ABP8GTJ5_9BURK